MIEEFLEDRKKKGKGEFLKKCQDILSDEYLNDEDKFEYMIQFLSEIESDIENILINILANKAKKRLNMVIEASNLLESALHFIKSKHRGKNHQYYKDLLFDKSKKFYKMNYPT